MPSFDITSEFNQQEVINAIDQMNREIINRYDFNNTNNNERINLFPYPIFYTFVFV